MAEPMEFMFTAQLQGMSSTVMRYYQQMLLTF